MKFMNGLLKMPSFASGVSIPSVCSIQIWVLLLRMSSIQDPVHKFGRNTFSIFFGHNFAQGFDVAEAWYL